MTAVLHVLLFLLKCLGILLLVLLGLFLTVLLLVLIAPVRYKGRLDKKEEPEEIFRADALISWLNPFFRVRIQYVEKKLRYTVRIFGICFLNSEKPKKEKTKKEKKKKNKKKEKQAANQEGQNQETAVGKPVQTSEAVSAEATAESTMPEGNMPETIAEGTETPELPVAQSEASEETEESGQTKKKRSVFSKIKQIVEKIKAIPEKIKQKIIHITDTLKLLWYKKEKVVAFLEDELHRTALGKGWDTVKQVIGHVLPGKIKGQVEFGTGDPESTGKALGVLGVLYAKYGKGVTIVPDFYEKRLIAELTFKGRIRFGTLLFKGLKLIRDKQVKRLYKNFKKLLKILKQKAE